MAGAAVRLRSRLEYVEDSALRKAPTDQCSHLELTFVAEKPPPAYVFEQTVLMAVEDRGEYEWRRLRVGSGLSLFSRIQD